MPVFPKWRGKQVLMRDENGLEKCVACGLCAVACPADAIYAEAAENDGSVQAGPRYAKVYQIHKTRCIFCGFCEEAYPFRRFHGQGLRAALSNSKDFIWDKHDLLVGAARRRRRRRPSHSTSGLRPDPRRLRLPGHLFDRRAVARTALTEKVDSRTQNRVGQGLRPVHFGALGDIHGDFASARRTMERHPRCRSGFA